ncbi:MAG: type II toxin-antitoxin system RelE/ParE family toxin [Rickettsiales bacterium]|nr:type II toxin-antitoxin system RelE/ParE family toxin [Rickettsiales bacterium]
MTYVITETEIFASWRDNLKDLRAKDKILARMIRAAAGNFGDWKVESGDVKAMRIDYGPAYRLYYVIRKRKIVFLLCGGDKGTQRSDIKLAVELAKGV